LYRALGLPAAERGVDVGAESPEGLAQRELRRFAQHLLLLARRHPLVVPIPLLLDDLPRALVRLGRRLEYLAADVPLPPPRPLDERRHVLALDARDVARHDLDLLEPEPSRLHRMPQPIHEALHAPL